MRGQCLFDGCDEEMLYTSFDAHKLRHQPKRALAARKHVCGCGVACARRDTLTEHQKANTCGSAHLEPAPLEKRFMVGKGRPKAPQQDFTPVDPDAGYDEMRIECHCGKKVARREWTTHQETHRPLRQGCASPKILKKHRKLHETS